MLVTIKLSEETLKALKLRAARHGRSVVDEIRAILEAAVSPRARLQIGTALAAFGKSVGGIELPDIRSDEPGQLETFEWSE